MAKQTNIPLWTGTDDAMFVVELIAFARLIAAAQREDIAKMFDGEVWAYDYREIAAAIRNSGGAA